MVRLRHFASQYELSNGVVAGPDGEDTLISVEAVQFGAALGDQFTILVEPEDLVDPDGDGPLLSTAHGLLNAISDLYVANFNRAPDVGGLAFWFQRIYSGDFDLAEIARRFTFSDEYRATYPPELTNRAFVERIYENLFDRQPDPGGWDFWEGRLDDGFPRDTFILRVINAAYATNQRPAGQESNRQQA